MPESTTEPRKTAMADPDPALDANTLTPTPGEAKTVPLPRISLDLAGPAASEPTENSRLGPYLLVKKLGAGGFGAVYHARHETLGRDTALKILNPQFAADAAFVTRFKREARAAARMEHVGIVQVYDVGEERGFHFIAMQYVDGISLESLILNRGKLTPNETISIGKRIAAALEYAHGHGIVHRDIKPGNILISRDSKVKVVDFGLARDLVEAGGNVSQTGQVLGTPHYMAPEQGRGEKVDARTDVYALGATLYNMVTGRTPFDGSNAISVIMKHASDPLVPPIQLEKGVPRALSDLIVAMMAKAPQARPQGMTEVLRALEAMRDARSQVVMGTLSTPPVPGRGRSRRWIVGAAGFLLLGIAVLALMTNKKRQPRALLDSAAAWTQAHPDQPEEAARRLREAIRHPAVTPEIATRARFALYTNLRDQEVERRKAGQQNASQEARQEAVQVRSELVTALAHHAAEPWAADVWKAFLPVEAEALKDRSRQFVEGVSTGNYVLAKTFLDPRTAAKGDFELPKLLRAKFFKDGPQPPDTRFPRFEVGAVGWPPGFEKKVGELPDAVFTVQVEFRLPRLGGREGTITRDLEFVFHGDEWMVHPER